MTVMSVAVACRVCQQITTIDVDGDGYLAWLNGELIQNAMPEVSQEDRELLISSTCDDCFCEMFDSFEE